MCGQLWPIVHGSVHDLPTVLVASRHLAMSKTWPYSRGRKSFVLRNPGTAPPCVATGATVVASTSA
jgi:hypothetical protein